MNVLSSLTRRTLPLVAAALIFSLAAPTLIAQNPSPTWAQDDALRIAKEVQKRLGSHHQLRGFRLDHLRFPWQNRGSERLRLSSDSQEQRSQRSQGH